MKEEYDIKKYSDKYVVGYTRYSGIYITKLKKGFAEGKMKITEDHLNPLNTVHGGAVFTLADSIGGLATRTLGANPTTCTSTISYLRPTMDCEEITAAAEVIKDGANTIVVDISVTSDKGVHVSHILATYFNLNK